MVVYSRPNCAPCATLKYWLNKKGINYKEIENYDKPIVPVIEVAGQTIVGLDFLRLGRLLEAHKIA